MTPEEAKQHLHNLLGPQLVFNKEFDKYFSILKDSMQQSLMSWCKNCKDDVAEGSVPDNAKFKDRWVFFRKIGSDVRCTLVKLKNSDFIEIHLTDHKEYDDIRLMFGYKKSSYYGS